MCKVVSAVCLSEVQIINSLLFCGMCGGKLSHSNCSAICFHMHFFHSMMLCLVALAVCTKRCVWVWQIRLWQTCISVIWRMLCAICVYVCMYTHILCSLQVACVCVLCLSCRATNYWTCSQHGHFNKSQYEMHVVLISRMAAHYE
jgi:hypothetical protein